MVRRNSVFGNLDWISVLLWMVIMAFGWMNIYSANIMEAREGMFDFSQRFGKQLIWIAASLVLAAVILTLDSKFYIHFSYILYALIIAVLAGVLLFGKEINGARSWFALGGFQLQPSEFAKPVTALALANLLTSHNFHIRKFTDLMKAGVIILLPALLILLQPDMGSALVYFVFLFVLFREGFSANMMIMLATLLVLFMATLLLDQALLLLIILMMGSIILLFSSRSFKTGMAPILMGGLFFGIFYALHLLLETNWNLYHMGLMALGPLSVILLAAGIRARQYNRLKILAGALVAVGFMIVVNYAMANILKPHQQYRIYVTLGLEDDPQGVGYNVNQSKIAIGSGGFNGKGYLNGTQTKLHFVPEQSTDFIFCTVGEEWGFLGTSFVILLYAGLLLRMLVLAERQRSAFSRAFGYGFISVLFIHFAVNIGMTIGLLPVIGIPLPFFSYGGSSLWAFTIFLFIMLRLDASRLELLR